MSLFTFGYDEAIEEATPYYYDEFLEMPPIIQLDCLQDAIATLTDLYNKTLEKRL